ncbi:hypothetical protein CEXT_561371 [Caerostris extrusa]|uniref:Uncharacterized protein n=1 Tax=Caerostris extrusa TaxID=172846 RepID=A0AAV4U2N6_CAEEX|nr:hypothetical protein CEXT_561371 [Caerostris extrusa]
MHKNILLRTILLNLIKIKSWKVFQNLIEAHQKDRQPLFRELNCIPKTTATILHPTRNRIITIPWIGLFYSYEIKPGDINTRRFNRICNRHESPVIKEAVTDSLRFLSNFHDGKQFLCGFGLGRLNPR